MDPTPLPQNPSVTWRRVRRADLIFALAVLAAYALASVLTVHLRGASANGMFEIAQRALTGHLDLGSLKGNVDVVESGGRYYLAQGVLQLIPYLPFALVPSLGWISGYVTEFVFGVPAALLALPLARAYGAQGSTAYWVAAAVAFGSLLLQVTAGGNFYWLAHAESFLALTIFLIEWAGRRRPVLLGLLLGLSFLARPTTVLAAIPFGVVLIWQRRDRIAAAVGYALPLAACVAVSGWFDWVRFGSPLETGYGISFITPYLEPLRRQGLFAVVHIWQNLRLALLAGFDGLDHAPYFTANPTGLSMLFVSPALLTSLWAGFKEPTARLMWVAAGLVAIPVLMYYGGGANQYGFRYSLDFTPFLAVLVAMGSTRWLGRPERALVLISMASIAYGILWYATRLHG